eukprot:gene5327-10651_t
MTLHTEFRDPYFRVALGITVVGALLSFLPLFLYQKIDDSKYESSESVPLYHTLISTTFKVGEAVSMAAAFPILFNFFIDLFVFSAKDINSAKLAIWILILTSIVPNMATFFYVIPNLDIPLLLLFPSCRIIPVFFSALWLLNIYGPSIWKWKLIMPVMLMHSITTVISGFKPFVNETERYNLDMISLPFFIIGGLIVLQLTLRWFCHIYLMVKSSKPISQDTITCTWNLLAIIFFNISILFVQYYLGDYLSVDAGPAIYTSRLYCITAFIITITSLNGRYE